MSLTPEQIAAAQALLDAAAAQQKAYEEQMKADLERMRQIVEDSKNNPHQ